MWSTTWSMTHKPLVITMLKRDMPFTTNGSRNSTVRCSVPTSSKRRPASLTWNLTSSWSVRAWRWQCSACWPQPSPTGWHRTFGADWASRTWWRVPRNGWNTSRTTKTQTWSSVSSIAARMAVSKPLSMRRMHRSVWQRKCQASTWCSSDTITLAIAIPSPMKRVSRWYASTLPTMPSAWQTQRSPSLSTSTRWTARPPTSYSTSRYMAR